jgi:hypothetical protein
VTGPTWLSDGLAALMIATAVYCAGHLIASRLRHREAEHDVDLMHIAMGIAMAGMLMAAFDRRGPTGGVSSSRSSPAGSHFAPLVVSPNRSSAAA